jgi:hypothetical protein
MKEFFKSVSPRRAVRDFAEFWRSHSEHRWPALGVSIALTGSMIYLFAPETVRAPPEPPEVIFISTWEDGRSELQIMASNCRNQELKEELEARLAERAEFRREIYMALGRATFIDVEAMERQAEEDRQRAIASGEIAAPPPPPENDPVGSMTVEAFCAEVLAGRMPVSNG